MRLVRDLLTKAAADVAREEPVQTERPWYKRPSTLAGLGALAAGGGAYLLSRRGGFAKGNDYLANLQREARKGDFHQVVDVSHMAGPGAGASFRDRLTHFLRPTADEKGRLDALNRLKLWAHYGDSAVPVAAIETEPGKIKRLLATPHGASEVPVQLKGTVRGRYHNALVGVEADQLIHGAKDVTGTLEQQQKFTRMTSGGKTDEARLLMQHAPELFPETLVKLPLEQQSGYEMLGGPNAGFKSRLQRLQAKLREHFGNDDYLLKETHGNASDGHFPRGGQDWGEAFQKFKDFADDPENIKALNAASAAVENGGHRLLKDKGLYEGYVLHKMLSEGPDAAFAQRLVPGAVGEWRVHLHGGSASPGMITPRFADGYVGQRLADPLGAKKKKLQELAESLAQKLPEEYRQGNLGLDVLEHRLPDGTTGYKIMELNPAQIPARAETGRIIPGSDSGLLRPYVNPGIGHATYKHYTGRDTVPMALGKGLMAAGATGAAVLGGGKLLNREQDSDSGAGA